MNEYEHELATRAHEAQVRAFHVAEAVETERLRPFMLLRPRMFPDGNQWCALYGDNIQEGVCGFGNTPEAAARQFDIEWLNTCAQKPMNKAEAYECHDAHECEIEHPCIEQCARFRKEAELEKLQNRENQSYAVFQTIADLSTNAANLEEIRRIAQVSADKRKPL